MKNNSKEEKQKKNDETKKQKKTQKLEKKEARKNKNANKKGTSRKTKRALNITLYITLITLISLISFVGVYVKDKNKMINKVPDYILGTDINGARNIVIKVDTGTTTKTYDANGQEVANTTSTNTTEGQTTKEVPANDSSLLNIDNYQLAKKIITDRLEYMKVPYYEIKANETDGTIYVEVPEDTNTDYIAQYCVTKGAFKITDNDTGDVLLTNSDIKEAKAQYSTSTSGTTVVLNIQFNKSGTEKLKDITNTYVKTTDSEGNEVSKKIKMALDDETIMTTTFDEEISNGAMQLSLGTSTDSSTIQGYVKQANNVAVFLNTEAMPITYKMDINRFVYSNINQNTLKIIIIVLSAIYLAMLIFMILKYKKAGILGAITAIGFVAILLLLIRYANVTLTLVGIFTIASSAIIEYILLTNMLGAYTKKTDKEAKDKIMKQAKQEGLESLIPLAMIAVIFAIAKWEPVFSSGMILFWSVIEMLIYNLITIKIICRKEDK